jgi:hypothetical protein
MREMMDICGVKEQRNHLIRRRAVKRDQGQLQQPPEKKIGRVFDSLPND